ncbi:hypothetical protein ACJX0J_010201, partial [Zea mays]
TTTKKMVGFKICCCPVIVEYLTISGVETKIKVNITEWLKYNKKNYAAHHLTHVFYFKSIVKTGIHCSIIDIKLAVRIDGMDVQEPVMFSGIGTLFVVAATSFILKLLAAVDIKQQSIIHITELHLNGYMTYLTH